MGHPELAEQNFFETMFSQLGMIHDGSIMKLYFSLKRK